MSDEFKDYQRDLDRADEAAPRLEFAESDRERLPESVREQATFRPDDEFQAASAGEGETYRQDFDASGSPVAEGDATVQVLRDLLDAVQALPAEIVEQLRGS